ncbi:hypothetical protein BDQ12DRAFT_324064 [Crucibulum laeve]|uniref:Uncharacterized protein n=1 Tax=Crucibulum laeve TaxID=68775 RepID=A0A5C3LQB3_9AGAR|nr:hypothetical protein BDQ12DRAFT_324064 [Crucibulum laeve]
MLRKRSSKQQSCIFDLVIMHGATSKPSHKSSNVLIFNLPLHNSISLSLGNFVQEHFLQVLHSVHEPTFSELSAQLVRIEQSIKHLQEQQLFLKTKINFASGVTKLPPELLSDIFRLIFYPIYDLSSDSHELEPSPLFLGQVCSSWRDIAWSTPRLWTSLKIVVSRHMSHDLQAQLVEEWISRSGQLPLSIYLSDPHNILPKVKGPRRLLTVLAACSDYWERIDCFPSKSCHMGLANAKGRLPALKELILHRGSDPSNPSCDLFFRAPSLRDISVVGLRTNSLRLPWSQLQIFRGAKVELRECYELLRLASNLVHAHFEDVFQDTTTMLPFHPMELITLERLEVLEVRGDTERDVGMLLDSVTLPSLLDISLKAKVGGIHLNPIVSLFYRSACNVRRVSVLGSRFSDSNLQFIDFLHICCSVVELHLSDYPGPHFPPGLSDRFFEMLLDNVLPDLRVFDYEGTAKFSGIHLLRALETRWAYPNPPASKEGQIVVPLKSFSLVSPGASSVDLSPDVLSRLQTLVDEGLDLRIKDIPSHYS